MMHEYLVACSGVVENKDWSVFSLIVRISVQIRTAADLMEAQGIIKEMVEGKFKTVFENFFVLSFSELEITDDNGTEEDNGN